MGLGCMAQISALDEVRGCRRCEDDDRIVPLFILWAYLDPGKVASVRNGVFGMVRRQWLLVVLKKPSSPNKERP